MTENNNASHDDFEVIKLDEVDLQRTEAAKVDFLNWIKEAKPSVVSLRELKQMVNADEINPNYYWDTDTECGCIKGALFYLDRYTEPEDFYFDLDEDDEDELEMMKAIDMYEHGVIEGVISVHFNGAVVNHSTPFESWLLNYYRHNSTTSELVKEWIDQAIAFMKTH